MQVRSAGGNRHTSLLRRTLKYPKINSEYHGVNRYEQISNNLVITATGEFADFQEATRELKELTRES